MKFRVVIHEAKEGGYWAEVLSLPGYFSQGKTKDEVMENVKEAIEAYLESVEKENLKSINKKFSIISVDV